MRRIILAVALTLSAGAASAQTNLLSGSQSGALAVAGTTNLVVPGGSGGNGTGTLYNLGTTGGNSVVNYDACLKNFSLTGWIANVNVPIEIQKCWLMRQSDTMAKFPPGTPQYEHNCKSSDWLDTDWRTGIMACTENKERLARKDPNDPRTRPLAYNIPAIQYASAMPMAPVPPTVVPVAPTNAPVSAVPPAQAFAAASYATASDCLTAAAATGNPLSSCSGKR